MDDRLRAGLAVVHVVAVEGDVEVAERDLGAGELADQRVQPLAEDRARGCGCRPGPRRQTPEFFSTISCAIRTSVRRRSSRSRTTLSFAAQSAPLPGLSGPG